MSEKFNLKRLVWSDVNLYLSLRIYVNHDFQDYNCVGEINSVEYESRYS